MDLWDLLFGTTCCSEDIQTSWGRSHKKLDLTDQMAVRKFFDEERPDAVVLAAAFVGGIMANLLYRADLSEIRNCHINVGTGKELTIRELSELVVKAVGFEGEVEFDASKPDGTMRKLIDVSKLHSLGWRHQIDIEQGVQKLFDWYQESLES